MPSLYFSILGIKACSLIEFLHLIHTPTTHSMSINTSCLSGITQALTDAQRDSFLEEDIEEDIEGKQGTLPDLVAGDASNESDAPLGSIPGLAETIAGASKGVADGTESEYHQ